MSDITLSGSTIKKNFHGNIEMFIPWMNSIVGRNILSEENKKWGKIYYSSIFLSMFARVLQSNFVQILLAHLLK